MIDRRNPNPDAELDVALMDPEGFLSSSLQEDEQKRRKRWLWISTCSTICCAVVAMLAISTLSSWFSTAAASETSRKTAEGWALWKERKLEAAELAFMDALRLHADDAEAWSGVGWCRNNRGLHKTAIEAFQKCLALNPNHSAAMNGVGQSALASGDFKEAEKWLYKASSEYLKQVPEDRITAANVPAAWFGLVQVYLLTGQYEQADVWAARLAKHKPTDERVVKFLKQARSRDNSELLKARTAMEERIRLGKSWQQASRGHHVEAIKGFEDALKEDENNVGALNGLAFALLNNGKHEEAKSLFEKCLKLKPDHYGAMNGLGRCLDTVGKTDEAIELWTKLCAEIKTVNAGTVALSNVYMKRKEYEKAIPYLKQVAAQKGPMADRYSKLLLDAEKCLAEKETE